MMTFKIPATRKKPTDMKDNYETQDYNITDGIIQEDDKINVEEYKGPTMHVVCQTDIDLAGQLETRQSTSSLLIRIQGAVVHWRAHTERIVIQSTAAGEYIALSRGNTTAKFVRDILVFYGNGKPHYYLFTDNQAEHIATQPNMNEHSRSIDIRHHAIRQDYIDGEMRIGGVGTQENTSDILTKNLQPPLHIKHTKELNIIQNTEQQTLTNCVARLTLNFERAGDDPDTSPNRHLSMDQQLPLRPSLKTNRAPIVAAHTDAHPHTCRQRPTTYCSKSPKERVNMRHRGAKRHRKKHQPGTLEELSKSIEILRGGHDACHDKPKQKTGDINPETHEMTPAFLDLIFPQHPQTNGHRSQHPRRCDNTPHTIKTKTRKKHDKRKSEAQKIRHRTGQTTQTNPTPTRTSIQPPRWQLKRTHTNNNTTLTAPPGSLPANISTQV
jgi:hypothetical protein